MDETDRRLVMVSWREGAESEVAFEEGEQLIDLIRRAGHPPDGVLVLRGDVPLPLDTILGPADQYEKFTIIRVASGG